MTGDAQQRRFNAFVGSTEPDERDWMAFCVFERAIESATDFAAMVNPYADFKAREREEAVLRQPIGEMLFRVLPRVGLGAIVANAEGIGYALRYGVIEPKATALDAIADTEDFEALAGRGHGAEQMNTVLRIEAAREEEHAEPAHTDA
jgi:hypothetical protein